MNRFGPEKKIVPMWESPARRRIFDLIDSCAILTRPSAACLMALTAGGLITAMLEKAVF